MSASSALDVQICTSITQVPASVWAAVDCGEPLISHPWLRVVEDSSADVAEYRYVLLHDAAGLLAAAVARLVATGSPGNGVDRMLFGRLARTPERVGLSILPALIVGVYEGTAVPVGWRPGLSDDERRQACVRLVDELEREAGVLGVPLAFTELPADEPVLQQELIRRGYPVLDYLPGCRMEIAGKNLLEHVRASGDAARSVDKDVRRERNKIAHAGISIEAVAGKDFGHADLMPMFEANYAKHGTGPFPFQRGFLQGLYELAPDNVAVFAARRGDQLLGASCLIHGGQVAHGKYFGVSPAEGETAFLYFGLVFHAPVEFVAARGIRRLEFGRGMYPTKTRRGCRLVGTRAYVQPRSMLGRAVMRGWTDLAGRWYRRKVSR